MDTKEIPDQDTKSLPATPVGSPPAGGPDVPAPVEASAADPAEQRAADTRRQLRWLNPQNEPVEVRLIRRGGGASSRVFGNSEDAASYCRSVSGPAHNVYVTLNPVAPERVGTQEASRDEHITRRANLLLDFDSRRPDKHTNATDAEKSAAAAVAERVRQFLDARGFPAPLIIDSGNGWHLVYAVDLPAADDRVPRLLRALSREFSNDAADVDVRVGNPSRITKVAGGHTGKGVAGTAATDRPDRYSRVCVRPDRVVAPVERIDAVLAELESKPEPEPQREPEPKVEGPKPAVETPQRDRAVAATWAALTAPDHPQRAYVDALIAREGYEAYVPDGKDKSPSAAFLALANKIARAAVVTGVEPTESLLATVVARTKWADYEKLDRPRWRRETFGKAIRSAQEWGAKQRPAPAYARTAFPTDLLPPDAAKFVREAAASIGCPEEYVALPCLTTMAGAVGTKYEVELKSGWVEPCVLWTLIVADSGTKKTPAFNLATGPARKIAAEQAAAYKSKQTEYDAKIAAWKAAPKAERGPTPERPKLSKWLLSDATVEAVADRLDGHPAGLLLVRDEMDAWYKGLNQYKNGGGSDRAAYLEMHSGGTVNVDRKNADRPSIFVPRACVSMCGGIQPDIFRSSFGDDDFASGLIPRFLVANLSGVSGGSGWSDAEVSSDATNGWENVVRKLLSLPIHYSTSSVECEPVLVPRRVQICPTARQLFIEHCNATARRMAGAGPEFRAALSKLEGAAARIALVLHLATCEADAMGNVPPVTEAAMAAGIQLAEWFTSQAFSLYGNRSALPSLAYRRLETKGEVSCRDLQRSNPRAYPDRDTAWRELCHLVESGAAVWIDAGRSRVVFALSGTLPDSARQPDTGCG
jgi:hypothetical protein